jgi:hypothetical protein
MILQLPLASIATHDSTAGKVIMRSDDVLVAIFLALTLLGREGRRRNGSTQAPLCIAFAVSIFLGAGAISSILHGVRLPIAALGAWLAVKLWTVLFITVKLPWTRRHKDVLCNVLFRMGLVVVAFGVVDVVARQPFRHFLGTDLKSYDFRASIAVQSIFPNAGRFAFLMTALFALAFAKYASDRKPRDRTYALIFALGAVSSLRLKGVLGLVASVMVILVMVRDRERGPGTSSKVRVAAVGLIVALVAVFGLKDIVTSQVERYATSSKTPRALLYTASKSIAHDNMPFGVGFGRFGTYPSSLDYSTVYDQYHLSSTWGLSRTYGVFISDTSWPAVLGETGYAGLIAYAVGLLVLLAWLIRSRKMTHSWSASTGIAAVSILVVIVLDSLGNSTLFDGVATMTFGLVAGYVLSLVRSPDLAMEDVDTPTPLDVDALRTATLVDLVHV